MLVSVWIARYLGPQQFGLLNYVMAFVAVFGALAVLGLDAIVVRDLVANSHPTSTTLGTAFFLQCAGGAVVYVLLLVSIFLARPADPVAMQMASILGLPLLAKGCDVVRYWFESRLQSRFVVLVDNGVFLTFAAAKIYLILIQAPLLAFVGAMSIETGLVCLGLLLVYRDRVGPLAAWRGDISRVWSLLKDSWPFVASTVAVMIYLRIDMIMLGQLLDDESVGIYSVAVRITEMYYFIPAAIIASSFPAIMEAKRRSPEAYVATFDKLLKLLFLLALSCALPISVFSKTIIDVLFGPSYGKAASVLSVNTWAGLFVFAGMAGGRWFLAENLQRLLVYRTALGACLNVLLNLVLIPQYGPVGAAWATLLSQAVSCVFSNALNPTTRPLFWMQFRAMTRWGRFGYSGSQ
jgi:O-antigen/teichoic acid export membrane protein